MNPQDFRRIALAHELLAPRPAREREAPPARDEPEAAEDEPETGIAAIAAEHDLVG